MQWKNFSLAYNNYPTQTNQSVFLSKKKQLNDYYKTQFNPIYQERNQGESANTDQWVLNTV